MFRLISGLVVTVSAIELKVQDQDSTTFLERAQNYSAGQILFTVGIIAAGYYFYTNHFASTQEEKKVSNSIEYFHAEERKRYQELEQKQDILVAEPIPKPEQTQFSGCNEPSQKQEEINITEPEIDISQIVQEVLESSSNTHFDERGMFVTLHKESNYFVKLLKPNSNFRNYDFYATEMNREVEVSTELWDSKNKIPEGVQRVQQIMFEHDGQTIKANVSKNLGEKSVGDLKDSGRWVENEDRTWSWTQSVAFQDYFQMLPPQERLNFIVDWTKQGLQVLKYFKSRNMMHRDVHDSNLVVDMKQTEQYPHGKLSFIDYGRSSFYSEADEFPNKYSNRNDGKIERDDDLSDVVKFGIHMAMLCFNESALDVDLRPTPVYRRFLGQISQNEKKKSNKRIEQNSTTKM